MIFISNLNYLIESLSTRLNQGCKMLLKNRFKPFYMDGTGFFKEIFKSASS